MDKKDFKMNFIVTEIDYSKKSFAIVDKMQLICLPGDDICPIIEQSDVWLVAKSGKHFAGFAGIRFLYDDIWYLCRAGVMPKFQGRGLQKTLIKSRISAAKALGAKTIITDCTIVNYASANSLISCGFKLFEPNINWALDNSIYWRLDL
jgi:predicted acetyltransferase